MNKAPWELVYTPWKTRAEFYNYMRGGLRKAVWARHPVKIEYIKKNRVKAPIGKAGKEVWACKCEICGKTFRQNECEVDHLDPAGSLRSEEHLKDFITKLAFVDFDDLRILDKGCHRIVSYAERMGLSFEEAKVAKEVIAKTKQGVSKQRKELMDAGFSEEEISNATKRKECYKKLIRGG